MGLERLPLNNACCWCLSSCFKPSHAHAHSCACTCYMCMSHDMCMCMQMCMQMCVQMCMEWPKCINNPCIAPSVLRRLPTCTLYRGGLRRCDGRVMNKAPRFPRVPRYSHAAKAPLVTSGGKIPHEKYQ